MPMFRSAICLALIILSVLASSVFAAATPQSVPAAIAAATVAAPDDARWDDRFSMEFSRRFGNPYPADLYTAAVFGGELYIAGAFQEGSTLESLRSIARWNGRQWATVGVHNITSNNGFSAYIMDLAVHEGKLYATGRFSLDSVAANIISWDGQQWEVLGEGLNDVGYALASYGGDLYVGGQFTQAGRVAAKGVARWDGAEWHAVGAGLQPASSTPSQLVSGLVATPQGLYAGGSFGASGNQQLHALARWDGSQWSAVIPELRGRVSALDWHDGALYAAGTLSFEGAVPSSGSLLRWDGAQGQFLDAGLGSGPATMVRSVGGKLYAAALEKLYRWNGAAWEPFGRPLADAGIGSRIVDIITYNNTLHLIGTVECQRTDCAAKNVLAWTGTSWNGLGEGVFSTGASTIAAVGDSFYLSPDLEWDVQTLGSRQSRNLGWWDGAGWHDASLGINAFVPALVSAGDCVYAARAVNNSNASPAYYTSTISRLDGGVATSLPGVFNGIVSELAYADGSVYAGGTFSAVGAIQARGVARWNGAAWAALGDPQLSEVKDLAVYNGAVYVAGIPSSGPGYPVILRWDGSTWIVLGTAFGRIEAIAVAPSGDLYIAGGFAEINNVRATAIARWRAGTWEAMPHDFQMLPSVGNYSAGMYALEIGTDGSVYVGGLFSSVGTPGMQSIARYDGSWHALGSGIDGVVLDLEASGDDMYVSGLIKRAGDKQSANVAIWHGLNPSTVFVPLLVR